MLLSRSIICLLFGGLALGCSDPPADDLLSTSAPPATPTPIAATPTPTPVPGSDFRIHPQVLHLPMGGQAAIIAANYGVPIDHREVAWTQSPDGPEYGQYVPEFGIYNAPLADTLPSEPITLTAQWTDLFGRPLEAKATITLTSWDARETGGPGSTCGGCITKNLAGNEGSLIVMRSPHGIWQVEPALLPAIPVVGSGSEEPECGTPPIDPMEGTPPGLPTDAPTALPTATPLTPSPTQSPLPTPTPLPTPSPDSPTPGATPEGDPFEGLNFYDGYGLWTRIGNAPPITGGDLQLFTIPQEERGLMALGEEALWRSPDGGESWVEQDVPGRPITLAFFPESNEDLLIPTRIETVFYMARSKNGGQTFSAWASSIDAPIERLAVVPRLTTRVIASTGDTLWLSEDDARTFRPIVEGLDDVHFLGAFLLGGAYAIVEVEGERRLLESSTAGEEWSTYEGIPDCAPLDLAVHPRNPSQLWITCVGGRILESYNGGEDFQPAPNQLPGTIPEGAEVRIIPEDFPLAVMEDGHTSHYFTFLSQDDGWIPVGPGPGPKLTAMTSGPLGRPDLSGEFPKVTAFHAVQVANEAGWVETSVSPLGRYWISRLGPALGVAGGPLSLSLGLDGGRAYAVGPEGELWGAIPGEEPYQQLPSPLGHEGRAIASLPAAPSSLLTVGQGGDLHQFEAGEAEELPQSPTDWTRLREGGVRAAQGAFEGEGVIYGLGEGTYLRSEDSGQSFFEGAPAGLGGRQPLGISVNASEVLIASNDGLFGAEDGQNFEALGLGGGAIGAMCRLFPRTVLTSTPGVPGGTKGLMAVSEEGGLGVRLEGEGAVTALPLITAKHPDGAPGEIRQIEPSGAFPGGIWAWVEDLGLYVVYPAPLGGELAEPGLPNSESGEAPVCP